MAKFKEGDRVYYIYADDEDKYFELRVATTDGEYFDAYVSRCEGYEGYEIGQFCSGIYEESYALVIPKDIVGDLLKAADKLEQVWQSSK